MFEVFDEFELANGEEDSINVYYKEDKEVFESDLTINNNYQIKVNGLSSGVYTATYTFIDNLEYAMNEKTLKTCCTSFCNLIWGLSVSQEWSNDDAS